ncbi:hypothetical protein DM02DRAFT_576098 [Periconia macrospinosa]|uniref:F-box domain-containing protein n=1 Tax=Periconia macrospinosa TaxID=97972 RepID=A0A2V1D2I3_9PLEO|nr:hypothetical protein DM02DRAFT_576098 [Periconia macrospinosa]
MHDREFKLQLGIPQEFPRKSQDKSCHYADGLGDCECVKQIFPKASIEDCQFYGRPIEPLAFYLPPFSSINQQKQSQLYNIPMEIRNLIFQFAFTDDGAPPFNCDNEFRRSTSGTIPSVTCACALLQTCKAVYLEAYRLPMLLNGYLAYRTILYYGRPDGSQFNSPSRPDLERIAPWQYALIQRIDLSFQQFSIESRLGTEIELWRPALRHLGAYVSPRYYKSLHSWACHTEPEVASHNFALVPATIENSIKGLKDGDKVTLERWDIEAADDLHDPEYSPIDTYMLMGNFTAAAMVARKLTHFTLRISRTDWWTWEDDPRTTDSDKQLALDPALGGRKPRPLLNDMVALADMRRAGHYPPYDDLPAQRLSGPVTPQDPNAPRTTANHHWYHRPNDGTWGAAIGFMPDLKTFELVLETFSPKKHQLEKVVECARTWKFPLKDTEYELVCDDKIEALQWSLPTDKNEIVSQDDEDTATESDGASEVGGYASQTTKVASEAQEDASEDSNDDLFADGNEPWHQKCTKFEVRVVRFRRQKVGSISR